MPHDLKSSNIVPIYKKGRKDLLNKYRPITLISNAGKIFEKLIYNRLENFFIKTNVFSDKQFGFMQGKGINDALAEFTEFFYDKLNHN